MYISYSLNLVCNINDYLSNWAHSKGRCDVTNNMSCNDYVCVCDACFFLSMWDREIHFTILFRVYCKNNRNLRYLKLGQSDKIKLDDCDLNLNEERKEMLHRILNAHFVCNTLTHVIKKNCIQFIYHWLNANTFKLI